MGLFEIPCKRCSCRFLWFSGNLDQRCESCKKEATRLQTVAAELHLTLDEWRNGGAPTERVVHAIMALIEDALDDYSEKSETAMKIGEKE